MPAPLYAQFITGQFPVEASTFATVAIAVVCTFLVVAFLLGLVATIITMVRRRVPLEVQIREAVQGEMDPYKDHFTQEIARLSREVHETRENGDKELREVVTQIDGIRKESETRSQQISATLQNGFADIHRALGVVEGIQRAQLLQTAASSPVATV